MERQEIEQMIARIRDYFAGRPFDKQDIFVLNLQRMEEELS